MSNSTYESWAVVELFGHQKIAGKVTEQSIGGQQFVRVDVPAQAPIAGDRDRYGLRAQPAIPEYTRMFGTGAIYAINPCTEQVARRAAEMFRTTPPIPFDVPDIVQTPQLEFSGDDHEFEEVSCAEHGEINCLRCL